MNRRSNIARALFLVVVLSAAPLIMHWSRKTAPGMLSAQDSPVGGVRGGMDAMFASGASAVVALEFGLSADSAPQLWKGNVIPSAGHVLGSWGIHFAPQDRIDGVAGFSFSTRKSERPKPPGAGPDFNPYFPLPNGIFVALAAPDSATLQVRTSRGDFRFSLAELKTAGRKVFLAGDVAASYLPPVKALTQGEATQHDFPSVAVRGEDLFAAWTAYHDEANLVYLAHRRGNAWKTYRVSETWGDYSGSAVAADGRGGAIVVWSEYRSDRWRLKSRRLDLRTGLWSAEQYVADASRRQLFPRMATDAEGRAWVVWQEFVAGSFGIFLSSQAGDSAWSKPLAVSRSTTNQWEPAIAAAPDGAVWVAWDGYNNGNYDIFLRCIRGRGAEEIIQVTAAATRDAHASVAVSSKNQVWLAWEEAGANWGKDSGVLIRTGEALHASRRIRLVRYANGAFTEPVSALEQNLPSWIADYQEYPQLAVDAHDVPRLFFRHFLFLRASAAPGDPPQMRFGPEERLLEPFPDVLEQMFNIFVTGFNGSDWLPALPVPASWGRCSMQTGAAALGDKIVYLWPSDGRSFEDRHLRSAQLRYADFAFDGRQAPTEKMKPFVSGRAAASDADSAEKRDLTRVRATRWPDSPPLRLFRGELHRHTDISTDGRLDGDVLDAYRYALDAAALDFMAVTEHTFHERLNYFRYDWWRSRQVATMFNNPGHFASLFGYERTVTYPGGHRNVISTRRDLQPVPIADEEYYGVQSYGERLYPNLRTNGDIAIAHTTSADGGTDWRDWNRQAEPVVEIFQGLRGSFEEPNGPGAARSAKLHPEGLVWRAWEKNRRVGVIASSDHASTHQSFACVYAPELTQHAILDAIRKRRTFAATDNIVVRLEAVEAGGTVWKMGAELKASVPPELRVQVEGTAVLSKVELIRNGKFVLVRQPARSSDQFRYRDTETSAGTYCYHVRLIQANGMIAWSSPIWVELGAK